MKFKRYTIKRNHPEYLKKEDGKTEGFFFETELFREHSEKIAEIKNLTKEGYRIFEEGNSYSGTCGFFMGNAIVSVNHSFSIHSTLSRIPIISEITTEIITPNSMKKPKIVTELEKILESRAKLVNQQHNKYFNFLMPFS